MWLSDIRVSELEEVPVGSAAACVCECMRRLREKNKTSAVPTHRLHPPLAHTTGSSVQILIDLPSLNFSHIYVEYAIFWMVLKTGSPPLRARITWYLYIERQPRKARAKAIERLQPRSNHAASTYCRGLSNCQQLWPHTPDIARERHAPKIYPSMILVIT